MHMSDAATVCLSTTPDTLNNSSASARRARRARRTSAHFQCAFRWKAFSFWHHSDADRTWWAAYGHMHGCSLSEAQTLTFRFQDFEFKFMNLKIQFMKPFGSFAIKCLWNDHWKEGTRSCMWISRGSRLEVRRIQKWFRLQLGKVLA